MHTELRRPGVTLQVLHLEYLEKHPHGYRYSQFCEHYRRWLKHQRRSMRQVHKAGDKLFVDYSGKKPHYVEPGTGEVIEVELFVAVLGASNYTYAEATRTQTLSDFIASHVRAFDYFGCVPALAVPDQLRSAVAHPDRYDPTINATYIEMAQHYGIGIIPARPRKPKDKAKVEAGVLVAQRWIMARLRNRTFFSLEELNDAVFELLEDLNTRPFQKLEGCRRSAFESIDRPAMKPLPATRYELAQWKNCGVNIDYHVECEDRIYSVPCALIGQRVEIRWTGSTVEVFHGGERVASHRRSYGPKGTAVTREEHRPKSHREYGQWPPERLVAWAASIGQYTAEVVREILSKVPHPEMGYRSCLALIRVGKRYGAERTEAACRRALEIGAPSRRTVEMLLKNGLEHDGASEEPAGNPVMHENIRGGSYFDRSEQGSETAAVRAPPVSSAGPPQSPGATATTPQCNLPFERASSMSEVSEAETARLLLSKKGSGYTN